jgi:membrane protein
MVKWLPLRRIFRKAKNIALPGLNGATLYDVGRFFFHEISTLKLQERTAAVTYNFLMALPPTLLFLFSLVPYLPLKNVEPTILNGIRLMTPNQRIYLNVRDVFTDFMHKQHHDVLSFGIVLVLFFSSNGMMGLMRSFDKSITLYKKRSGLQRRWTAVKLTIMLIGVTIISLSVFIIQSKRLNSFVLRTFHTVAGVKIISMFFLVAVVFIAISLIYTYGPSLTRRFRFFSAGSVFATLGSITATSVFFFLVNNFLNYNKIYGSVGTLIAFMVWVWLNTAIILLGYELNVSILLGKLSRGEHDAE